MDLFHLQQDVPTFLPSTRPSRPQDWERQRERIARYYIQDDCTLDELRATMLQQHGFNATKRQYCTKLKQWNLKKYLTASDKDQIIDKIVAARLLGQTIAQVSFDGHQVDLKSLLRHARSQVSSSEVGTSETQILSLHENLVRRSSTGPVIGNAVTKHDHIRIICEETDVPQSSSSGQDADIDEWVTVVNDASHTVQQQLHLGDTEGVNAPRLYPSLSYAPTIGLERIVSLSQDYILEVLKCRTHMMSAQPLPSSSYPESAAMRSFWVDTKNSLYMAKKHLPDMAFTFASHACAAIQNPTAVETDLGTLKDVLATLSPTNADSCLPLRDHLLHYLSEILGMRFGATYPLVLLCEELRQETSNREIYETAMLFAIETIEIAQGAHESDVLEFRREFIRLLRRSGDINRAKQLCLEQETHCARSFGVDATITRRATSDRIHVLMAEGESVEAMAICEDLIERCRRDQRRSFPDDLAVYALEDLAELCEQQDSTDRGLFLLHEAYFGAVRLWGKNASSAEYILSKINAANKR